MEITKEWLSEQCACQEGIIWFENSGKTESSEVIELLLKEEKLMWANWLIARLLSQKDGIRYAIFAAEQVIGLFEKRFPDDKRPREAIEAAKAVFKKNSKASGAAGAAARAAQAAGDAAGAAAWSAASAASGAAWAAGAAARAAASAASGAAWAAGAAARAAQAAGDAAGAAGRSVGDAMKKKIVRYGLDIHRQG